MPTTGPSQGTMANGEIAPEKKDEFATLTFPDGKVHKIKIFTGQMDNDKFLDIRDLYAKTQSFTYDPGFTCTASCSSSITYINGGAGVLLYRGYDIDELCEKSNFLEVAYLLFTGELPAGDSIEEFRNEIKRNMLVHEKLKKMFDGFRVLQFYCL